MRTITGLGCILGVLTIGGAAAAVSNAMTISANSFEDFSSGGSSCVSKVNNGISNICAFDTSFSYGIPKGPSSAGYQITFTGNHSSVQTSTPTVFSNASNGNFLAFNTNNANNLSGNWSRTITFSAAQAPASGRLTAIVGIPGNQQGWLYGLSLAY